MTGQPEPVIRRMKRLIDPDAMRDLGRGDLVVTTCARVSGGVTAGIAFLSC